MKTTIIALCLILTVPAAVARDRDREIYERQQQMNEWQAQDDRRAALREQEETNRILRNAERNAQAEREARALGYPFIPRNCGRLGCL